MLAPRYAVSVRTAALLLVLVGCAGDEVRRVVTILYDRDERAETARWRIALDVLKPPEVTVTTTLAGGCRLTELNVPYVDRDDREVVPGHAMLFVAGQSDLPLVSTDWRAPLDATVSCRAQPEACAATRVRVSGYSATEGPFDVWAGLPGAEPITSPPTWCSEEKRPLVVSDGEDLVLTWRAAPPGHGVLEFSAEGAARRDRPLPKRALFCEFSAAAGRGVVPRALLARTYEAAEGGVLFAFTRSTTVLRFEARRGPVTVRLVGGFCDRSIARENP